MGLEMGGEGIEGLLDARFIGEPARLAAGEAGEKGVAEGIAGEQAMQITALDRPSAETAPSSPPARRSIGAALVAVSPMCM